MNYSTDILLDTRHKKKDGTYPLVLKIIINRVPTTISLKKSFLETEWDTGKKRANKKYKGTQSLSRLNAWIAHIKAEADTFLDQQLRDKTLSKKSVPLLRAYLFKPKQEDNAAQTNIADFVQSLMEQMIVKGKIGTAKSYKETITSMLQFDNRPLVFTDITYQWLTEYETFYLAKGNTINGLAVRMRTIRAMYNKAIKVGIAQQEDYPFKHYTIKTQETKRRALQHSDLQKLLNYSPETASETRALDYFFISYYLRGMNFSDMAHCTVGQIRDGLLHYTRLKTKKHFTLRLPSAVLPIIEKYAAAKSPNDYLLPIITKTKPQDIYTEINAKLRNCNKRLKKIAIKLGLQETNITTYVARHTYATQAKKKGVPIAAISDMLGHKSLAITETYLDSFSNEELDLWSEKIFE